MRILLCSSSSLVQQRFVRRMWSAALLCVLCSLVAAIFFRLVHHPVHVVGYPVAVLPALPILWALAETGIYLRNEKDEFQRDLLVQALLYATGLTLAVVTASAYLKDFAGVPALPLVWVYPLFWVFVGIAAAVLLRRYR